MNFIEFENLTFLIIDEFDAYYHFDLSEKILTKINSYLNFQSIITTHNTHLMKSTLTRPDCCYIIKDCKKISPLYALTNKEIREDNNLEKMYINGEFKN